MPWKCPALKATQYLFPKHFVISFLLSFFVSFLLQKHYYGIVQEGDRQKGHM